MLVLSLKVGSFGHLRTHSSSHNTIGQCLLYNLSHTAVSLVLYVVDKGLCGRNVLQSLLLILLRICSQSVRPMVYDSPAHPYVPTMVYDSPAHPYVPTMVYDSPAHPYVPLWCMIAPPTPTYHYGVR